MLVFPEPFGPFAAISSGIYAGRFSKKRDRHCCFTSRLLLKSKISTSNKSYSLLSSVISRDQLTKFNQYFTPHRPWPVFFIGTVLSRTYVYLCCGYNTQLSVRLKLSDHVKASTLNYPEIPESCRFLRMLP